VLAAGQSSGLFYIARFKGTTGTNPESVIYINVDIFPIIWPGLGHHFWQLSLE
jgi:hypothetical protein